jgi:3-oxoadipate enol-lactonase
MSSIRYRKVCLPEIRLTRSNELRAIASLAGAINACRLIAILILVVGFNEALGAEPMKTGLAKVNGTSLYYEVNGKGFPLVFVSGGGILDRRCWDEQFETFAKTYRAIRYDVRGIGKSARPRETFSHSQDLYALLKFLRIKRAHLIALSVGGAIAIDFTLEHPAMVDHLILAAPGLSSDAKDEANMQSVLALSALTKKEGLERVIQLTLDAPFVVSKENAAAREKIRQIYLDNRDVFESDFPLYVRWQPTQPPATVERLAEIRARALIIRGDNDSPAYISMTDKIGSGINGASKVVIPGGTHFINLEKPKEFNQVVLEFLNGNIGTRP